jgi:hypothetical protein
MTSEDKPIVISVADYERFKEDELILSVITAVMQQPKSSQKAKVSVIENILTAVKRM